MKKSLVHIFSNQHGSVINVALLIHQDCQQHQAGYGHLL
jgi:hypothetical protein